MKQQNQGNQQDQNTILKGPNDNKVGNIPKISYSLYFAVGNDERLLDHSQQQQILQIMQKEQFKNSAFLYNSNQARRKIRNWKTKLPWITPHYAIKSNPTQNILRDLVSQGSSFDCASQVQIQKMLSLGAKVDQIVYSNSIKDEEDLWWAHNNGIKLTTADTIDQLLKIKKYAPSIGILWRLSIKQALDKESGSVLLTFSSKFGDDLQTEEQIRERMKQIQTVGISLKGIHFHCGSGQHGSSGFSKAIAIARECIKIGRQYGHEMSLLDLGGGFPSGELTQNAISILRATQNDPLNYRVIAQPGRHFCSHSFYLLTKVLAKRTKYNRPCYHLNQSLYHSFNCMLMDGVSFQGHTDKFYSSIQSNKRQIKTIQKTHEASFFGMTCDGTDIIVKNIYVPQDLKMYDWICFSGMGAYTYGQKSTFNGMMSLDKIIPWSTNVHKQQK